jgi:hypothetical protein
MKCGYCGAIGLEPGFISDSGQSSPGYARWVQGALERGIFGGAKVIKKPKWQIEVFRCPQCAHLEMFAPNRV